MAQYQSLPRDQNLMDIGQIFAYTNKNTRSIILFDKTKPDFSDNGFIVTDWAQF